MQVPYRPPHRRRDMPAKPPKESGSNRANHGVEPDAHGEKSRDATAIAEARRLYIGNMPYFATESDVRTFFQGWPIEYITISIDPFTGRNPSYAFVDLSTPEDAHRAITELNGKEMLGRPVKVNIGVASSRTQPSHSHSNQTSFIPFLPGRGRVYDRWKKPETESIAHFDYASVGRRLYMGNLPSFQMNPARVDAEIQHFFKGFQIEAVSKIIPPHESNLSSGHYVFVDVYTADEAARAVRELHSTKAWGGTVKVSLAKQPRSWKVEARSKYLENHEGC